MELLVRRNDLVKELHLVQGIVERKNSIPILSNILVEARSDDLRISATDLDVSLRCGCSAQVIKEGAVTLGAKKLYEIAYVIKGSDPRRAIEHCRAVMGMIDPRNIYYAKSRKLAERLERSLGGKPVDDGGF